MEKWKGKIAVVTGASEGIGKAITLDLITNGIKVIGLSKDSEKNAELVKECDEGQIFAYDCNVTDLESVKKTFAAIEEKFGFIHILVNNAGIGW